MMKRAVLSSLFVIILALALFLPSLSKESGDFFTSPHLTFGPRHGLDIGFQVASGQDGAVYEIRTLASLEDAWKSRGRYNGVLAGLVRNGSDLWVATSDGSLVRMSDVSTPVTLPDNNLALLDIAWYGDGIVGLDNSSGVLRLLKPGADQSWEEVEVIRTNVGTVQKARLIPIGETLHLVWQSADADLTSGALTHVVRENGLWDREEAIPIGGSIIFTVFQDGSALRLVAKSEDLLGRLRPPAMTFLVNRGSGWLKDHAVPESIEKRLLDAFDFAAVGSWNRQAWLFTSYQGASVMMQNSDQHFGETSFGESLRSEFGWSGGFTVVFTVLMALLLVRSCRRSRLISKLFPGRPADLMSRAIALFIDNLITSVGVGVYHFASGDLNIYEELFTVGMMNQAFWINLGALVVFTAAMETAFGSTPGKWLMGLRVRSVNGGPPTAFQAIGRDLLRLIDMFPLVFPGLIGVIAAVANKRRQRIGDWLAGTIVRRHAPLASRKIVLASASPRRRELLEAAGLEFEVRPAYIDESAIRGETPRDAALLIAKAKAGAVLGQIPNANEIIIAADTIVVVDEEILGKPRDEDDAKRMLTLLSGRSHKVITGVVVWDALTHQIIADAEETEVEFRTLVQGEIDRYVASGDAMDKAGAYGIQSGYLVRQVRGSLSNVAGLPMELLNELLRLLDS